MSDLRLRFLAEFAGTATLLAGVVGSGIMATQLAGNNAALALLVNAAATAAVSACRRRWPSSASACSLSACMPR